MLSLLLLCRDNKRKIIIDKTLDNVVEFSLPVLGSDSKSSLLVECLTNLWLDNVPSGVSMYCWAISLAVFDAAQKY